MQMNEGHKAAMNSFNRETQVAVLVWSQAEGREDFYITD